MDKKRNYRRNTVKGSRKGQKWPEEVRIAAVCDLMVSNNICTVARKYGVPESTLRTWLAKAEKLEPGEKKSLFAQERERQIRALGHMAAAAARNSVQYIATRLENNARDAELHETLKRTLDFDEKLRTVAEHDAVEAEGAACTDLVVYGAPGTVDLELTEEDRERIARQMARHKPMSDFAATNYLRTLTSVAAKAVEMTGDANLDERRLDLNFTYTDGNTSARGAGLAYPIVQNDEGTDK